MISHTALGSVFFIFFLIPGSSAFPGVNDLLHEVDKLEQEEKNKRFEEIKRHLSDLMIVFHQATQWLNKPDIL